MLIKPVLCDLIVVAEIVPWMLLNLVLGSIQMSPRTFVFLALRTEIGAGSVNSVQRCLLRPQCPIFT